MRIFFFLPENRLNDATQHFVNLATKAFRDSKFEVVIRHNRVFEILPTDYIFVTTIKDFITIYLRNRSNKIIFWSQGLLSEEHLMMFKRTPQRLLKCQVFDLLERITLKKSLHTFYVSDYMKTYLSNKHSLQRNNYSIIPCYNKKLNEKYFNQYLKKKTSFVYAGGLYPWQCFEQTVALYKQIEHKNNNAIFTVLTKQKEEAKRLLIEENIKNYNILYVPLEGLDEELAKHKYGFMLREDNVVNSCATPTKMNTYLSVGLIPIYTNAIPAFNTHLDLRPYEIKADLGEENEQIAEKIITHDNIILDYHDYYKVCQDNFKDFYDDEFSIDKIKTELIEKKIIRS